MTALRIDDEQLDIASGDGPWALETRDLTVTYGDFIAAANISLRVAPGEIYGLLGPNGAGKTSVIRALTTIIPIAHGTAAVDGNPLTDPIAVRSSIGVLPESNGYPRAQTGRSYLRFYGQLFGLGRTVADERAERLLLQLGLGENYSRIATFSRGMRQRLGLARALINEPAVLFLDEPTLGLDPAGKEDIMAHITRSATDDGTCVILCSHLLDEVERVCDRVAILDRSRIVAEGTVDDVVDRAAVARHGRIRVAAESISAADSVLTESPAATAVRFDNTRPGDIDFQLDASNGSGSQLLRALLDADIEVLAFDLHSARLSDAFLALTGGAPSQSTQQETP